MVGWSVARLMYRVQLFVARSFDRLSASLLHFVEYPSRLSLLVYRCVGRCVCLPLCVCVSVCMYTCMYLRPVYLQESKHTHTQHTYTQVDSQAIEQLLLLNELIAAGNHSYETSTEDKTSGPLMAVSRFRCRALVSVCGRYRQSLHRSAC